MAKKQSQGGDTLDTARKVVSEIIDSAARLVGQAGEQAADAGVNALDTTADAVAAAPVVSELGASRCAPSSTPTPRRSTSSPPS